MPGFGPFGASPDASVNCSKKGYSAFAGYFCLCSAYGFICVICVCVQQHLKQSCQTHFQGDTMSARGSGFCFVFKQKIKRLLLFVLYRGQRFRGAISGCTLLLLGKDQIAKSLENHPRVVTGTSQDALLLNPLEALGMVCL